MNLEEIRKQIYDFRLKQMLERQQVWQAFNRALSESKTHQRKPLTESFRKARNMYED